MIAIALFLFPIYWLAIWPSSPMRSFTGRADALIRMIDADAFATRLRAWQSAAPSAEQHAGLLFGPRRSKALLAVIAGLSRSPNTVCGPTAGDGAVCQIRFSRSGSAEQLYRPSLASA